MDSEASIVAFRTALGKFFDWQVAAEMYPEQVTALEKLISSGLTGDELYEAFLRLPSWMQLGDAGEILIEAGLLADPTANIWSK